MSLRRYRTAASFRAVALLAAALATPVLPARADTVAQKLFAADPMRAIKAPVKLEYDFAMRGATIDPPFTSHVEMDVRTVRPDGTKEVWFDMFEGANRRAFGPVSANDQNPLVIVFLQRDVAEMQNLTGGAAGYFQTQIRRALRPGCRTRSRSWWARKVRSARR